MKFEELENLNEGIEDKGILKAIYFAGLPGAGKTTIAGRITDGQVAPRTVNTDKSFEFLSKKAGMVPSSVAWALVGPSAKVMNNEMLFQYLNSMLPLYVDGTSANPGAALRRVGLTESLGYDTMMIWVNIDVEEAIDRAKQRERKVDPDYIRKVHDAVAANKPFYAQRFGKNFVEVDNTGRNFDSAAGKVGNIADNFFLSPVNNPIGVKLIQHMRETGDKYLIPNHASEEYLKKIVSVWYMK